MRGRLQPLLCLAAGAGGMLAAAGLHGQGVASRGVTPQRRGKPPGLPIHARFVDVAAEAGLRGVTVYGPVDRKDNIVETVGCGAALVDVDRDGWLDVLVLSGSRLTDPPLDASNRLYRNNRDGTFTDITASAGLERTGWASSVAVADYDGDGDEDLFITDWGQNALYRNDGSGRFQDVAKAAGLLDPVTRWGAGATFIDHDRDGDLDLFLSNYPGFDRARASAPGSSDACQWKGVPVNCGPRGLPPGLSWFYRNNGDGTFTDVSDAVGIRKTTDVYGMTAVAADLDGDGWQDLDVAGDSTSSLLFNNKRDGAFVEEGLVRGGALSDNGLEQAGMGVAIGDYDRDGDLDIFKTHFADDTNVLYRNARSGQFADVTEPAGLGVETRFVGWGAAIADLDHDGPPDIFYVTGNVYPEVARALPAYPFRTPRVVFRNLGDGRFEELVAGAGPAVAASHASRGAAFGDIDNHGDVDAVIVNLNEPPSLALNHLKTARHCLTVVLAGERGPSPIGARVTVETPGAREVQEVTSQASFYSASDKRLHFGLGAATSATVHIRWPQGRMEKLDAVAADQFVVVQQGKGVVERRDPGWVRRGAS